MSATRARLVLSVVATDATFSLRDVRGDKLWVGKCIHCRSALTVSPRGETFGATIEHIVPKNHGGTDEPSSLALACARCNHQKGVRLDSLSPSDPKVVSVRHELELRRRERWREP